MTETKQPEYDYSQHIKPVTNFFDHKAKALMKNNDNLTVFTLPLTEESSDATYGETLGDRYFEKTIGTCKLSSGESRDRYLWVNNEITDGGILTSLSDSLNDMDMNFSMSTPDCKCVKGTTRYTNPNPPRSTKKKKKKKKNKTSRYIEEDKYHYIAEDEYPDALKKGSIEESDKCEEYITDGFSNMNSAEFSSDPIHKLYLTSITLLGGYIMFMLYSKRSF